jgi:predicted HAD superfamily Cof-like phosphohydrolase
MNLYDLIKEFHVKFELEYKDKPRTLPLELRHFRIDFMEEELVEYIEASHSGNLEKQLDALVDLVYVALGTAHMQGFDFNEAFKRVHEANMKKIRATNAESSKRKSAFDVIKPPGWSPPDLSDLVK